MKGTRQKDIKSTEVQLWQLPLNYWKLNFNMSAEDSHRVILHTHTERESHKEY